jgi:pSer/pThr/pTyr-binding forkhead associated (FHA) protein
MAFLKVFALGQERTVFLGDAPVVVGRDAHCDVHVEDVKVSRRHCVIEPLGGGRWRVRDLGSGNGTRVNGREVESHDLVREDVVEVGDAKVLFAGEAAAVVAHAPAEPREPSRRRAARSRRPAVVFWLGAAGLALGAIVLILVIQGLRGKESVNPEEERHYRSVVAATADEERLKFAEMFLASYPRSSHAEEALAAADAARARLAGAAQDV